jgi:hypothetical protein
MNNPSQNEADTIKVRRARVDSITVYDVTEQELEQLEKGGGGGIYLNLCLSIFSIAASFLIAVITTKIESDRQFAIFIIITTVGFLGALVLGILWWRCRESVTAVVLSIKRRMPLDETADIEEPGEDAVEKVPV